MVGVFVISAPSVLLPVEVGRMALDGATFKLLNEAEKGDRTFFPVRAA